MSSSAPPSKTSLFVGNLDTRVYRELLIEIFSLIGPVTHCHIVFDKNTGTSSGYGFIDFSSSDVAQTAIEKLRGRTLYGKLLTVDWARMPSKDVTNNSRIDETSAYCLFVGNLSTDVTDGQLKDAFGQFGNCVSAKCARDLASGKVQGFAFVSFEQRKEALSAMEAMNVQTLNNRQLRVEWARGKTNAVTRAAALGLPDVSGGGTSGASASQGLSKDGRERNGAALTYEAILQQTSMANITAYVAGLNINTKEIALRDVFSRFGEIKEIRIPDNHKQQTAQSMYAFVRYVDHDSAARAIFEAQNGLEVEGRQVQVHWGRENNRRMGGYRGGYRGGFHQNAHGFQQGPYGGRGAYYGGMTGVPYQRTPGQATGYPQGPAGGQNRYRAY